MKVLKFYKKSKNIFNLPQKDNGLGVFNFVTKPQKKVNFFGYFFYS
jgi:hypothetical protein